MSKKQVMSAAIAMVLTLGGLGSATGLDPTTPPADSAEAERVRIWLSVEHKGRCRLTVEIRDDSGRTVRHLVDYLVAGGYYNYYWDKRNDSGLFVAAGDYTWYADDCGRTRNGRLKAQYHPWERASSIEQSESRWTPEIAYALERDSALVSVEIYNRRDRLVDQPMTDSLHSRGSYVFHWQPKQPQPRGRYTLKLTVGGFCRILEIGYEP